MQLEVPARSWPRGPWFLPQQMPQVQQPSWQALLSSQEPQPSLREQQSSWQELQSSSLQVRLLAWQVQQPS